MWGVTCCSEALWAPAGAFTAEVSRAQGPGDSLPNPHPAAAGQDTSKVILKILQARLQQYVNRELSDTQSVFPLASELCRGLRGEY